MFPTFVEAPAAKEYERWKRDTTRRPRGLAYENAFRVTIVQFLDRFNFCVGNVKRSCIHFVTPEGQIIPFDPYNLFYRDGRIHEIRARLQEELQP